jgi:hypothetical protein
MKTNIKIIFYSFCFSFLLLSNKGICQKSVADTAQKRLSIGVDISKPIIYLFDKNKFEFEGSITYSSYKNFHPTVELGIQNAAFKANDSIKTFDYSSNGKFIRIGADYNTFRRNLKGENNHVFFGFRYGFASQNHNASGIMITDKYWPNRTALMSTQEVQTHWLEITSGIHVQFYKYFAAGWTVRGAFLLAQQNTSAVKPYYIPGYGKGANNFNFGFTYSLYYTFPL